MGGINIKQQQKPAFVLIFVWKNLQKSFTADAENFHPFSRMGI
jgi:hypothetical protein